MILAVFRVMLLELLRDRGALALAFLLPPLVFVILATVFSGTGGEDLRPRIAIAVLDDGPEATALVSALRADPQLRVAEDLSDSAASLRDTVREGRADAGLLLRGVPGRPAAAAAPPPLLIVTDPGRSLAGAFLAGRIREATLGDAPRLIELETLGTPAGDRGTVSYYAGAVAVLFLLFAAMDGAGSLIEERRSGVFDRLLIFPGSGRALLLGKFLFLVAQGLLQVSVIFLVAWLFYEVQFWRQLGPWLLTTALAAATAAGLALGLAAACRSRQQAQAVSTFAVLVFSAATCLLRMSDFAASPVRRLRLESRSLRLRPVAVRQAPQAAEHPDIIRWAMWSPRRCVSRPSSVRCACW